MGVPARARHRCPITSTVGSSPTRTSTSRTLQGTAECHLGGGAALSGAFLAHRRSRDLDLFVHDREAHRALVRELPNIALQTGLSIDIVRDGGTFVRATVGAALELDLVHEPQADLAPAERIEDVEVESLIDLRASKLTCLLSRTEPRDLVDVMFLERAGYRAEDDLVHALRKDAGIDPGVLAWLLETFPTSPLPDMLVPLTSDELRAYRDDLRDRLRRLAVTR